MKPTYLVCAVLLTAGCGPKPKTDVHIKLEDWTKIIKASDAAGYERGMREAEANCRAAQAHREAKGHAPRTKIINCEKAIFCFEHGQAELNPGWAIEGITIDLEERRIFPTPKDEQPIICNWCPEGKPACIETELSGCDTRFREPQ